MWLPCGRGVPKLCERLIKLPSPPTCERVATWPSVFGLVLLDWTTMAVLAPTWVEVTWLRRVPWVTLSVAPPLWLAVAELLVPVWSTSAEFWALATPARPRAAARTRRLRIVEGCVPGGRWL